MLTRPVTVTLSQVAGKAETQGFDRLVVTVLHVVCDLLLRLHARCIQCFPVQHSENPVSQPL